MKTNIVNMDRKLLSKSFHALKHIREDVGALIDIRRNPHYKNPAYPSIEDINKSLTEMLSKHTQNYNYLNPGNILKLPSSKDVVNLLSFKNTIETRLKNLY